MSPCSTTTIEEPPLYFPDKHDPNAGKQGPWRFLVELPDLTETVVSATVTIVNENDYPVPFDATGENGDSLVVTFLRVELTTDQLKPNTWAVYFDTEHGASDRIYRLKCRGVKNTGYGFDMVMLLVSKN